MVDQRALKKFLQENPGTYFSVLEIARINNENVRSTFSKMAQLKSDPDIITKQLQVGGQVGIVNMYAFQSGNTDFSKSMSEYHSVRNRPESKMLHTETVESILIISKLDEIISLLKGVTEKWK